MGVLGRMCTNEYYLYPIPQLHEGKSACSFSILLSHQPHLLSENTAAGIVISHADICTVCPNILINAHEKHREGK